jgi:uncharacterized protein (TIGR02466 family)
MKRPAEVRDRRTQTAHRKMGGFLHQGIARLHDVINVSPLKPKVFAMQVTQRDLFPTRVWAFDAPELLEHHERWAEHIQRWRAETASPSGFSNRMGWNSEKNVFSLEVFEPLKKLVTAAFLHAFKEMQLRGNLQFQLEAWANLHDPGGYNTLHVHPNVLLSGCYYVRAPAGSGAITFRDPRPGVVLTALPGTGVNGRGTAGIEPAEGRLVVFPHWLDHQVEQHTGTEPRIAIAMNALRA